MAAQKLIMRGPVPVKAKLVHNFFDGPQFLRRVHADGTQENFILGIECGTGSFRSELGNSS